MRPSKVVLGFVGGLVLAAAVPSDGTAAPADFMEGFKAESISAILAEAGATDIKTTSVGDDPRVTFTLGKTVFVADFYSCADKAKGCKLLQFVVAYTPDPTDTVEAVNSYNAQYVFGKAAVDKTDGLLSMRVVNGVAGATKAQVAAELIGFLSATEALLAHLKAAAGITASAPPPGRPAIMNTAASKLFVAPNAKRQELPKNRR